ncbi:MAG: cobaltochelatase CobN [Archaeoglobaceae archaeon]|nr:cobaltochelatase CobN [Archaeoglobaceae archaeon]
MKLVFIIGYDSVAIPLLRDVLKSEAEEHGFEFMVLSDSECSSYINELINCDALFAYSRNLPEEVVEIFRNPKAKVIISVHPEYPSKIRFDSFLKAREFWLRAGKENFSGLVHLILKELGFEVEVPEVRHVPWHGIYHPDLGIFDRVEQFLKKYEKRPLVGIIAYRNHVLFGKAEYLDELIREIEKEGVGVIPVFTRKHKDEFVEVPDVSESIDKFFFLNGEPLVDAIINLSYFSLLKGKIEILRTLGVPVLSPLTSFYMTLEEWLESDSIDYLSQVYNVIMPEIDGLIEPIPYSFPLIGETKDYKPFRPHAKLIARRVKKWVELRRKKVSERKIAIVLINPPCKNLESSIGVGFGLDVPESVVRLLSRLKELGYAVENEPKSGEELIRTFLSRKAISEFRWTSVEEVVAKGGALGFVDYETYISWLSELPEEAREKLIRDWGDPAEVLARRIKKELVGMVYDGKFVIPGLRFGNIVILTQPKFGCAGSACNGNVCRILHDPTITPPHQWLAVYRWLTRIFKADILIHFGTHGYLEFRPGKGVGLSPSCWPEISIDDVPHLYVYAVSNPMEGVIAKRRSYATILDHVYPPMAMADVLEDIESLISQFTHAKCLGDLLRAEKIYEELLEKAKKANLPIIANTPEKVVEELHRHVTAIRETQIELGLHIFGSSNREKAIEYVITAMAKDTHSYPSIRRVLAEYLGLDYDELKERPMEVNRLGLINTETMRFLHKTALEVLKRLVDMGLSSKSIEVDVLKQILMEVVDLELRNLKRECSS